MGAVASLLWEPREASLDRGPARGEPPPSAAVPAHPQEPTSLPARCPAIFPAPLSSSLLPPLQPVLISRPTYARLLPARIRGSRGQPLTRSAEDTWLSPGAPPLLWASVCPAVEWGQSPKALGTLQPVYGLSLFPGKDRARAVPTQGWWSPRPRALFPEAPERPRAFPPRGAGLRGGAQVQRPGSPSPRAEPLPGLRSPGGRQARRPAALGTGGEAAQPSCARGGPPSCRRPPPSPPLPSPSLPHPLPPAPWQPAPPSSARRSSPWEPDSSGLGTDAPSLASPLPLALGGGGIFTSRSRDRDPGSGRSAPPPRPRGAAPGTPRVPAGLS